MKGYPIISKKIIKKRERRLKPKNFKKIKNEIYTRKIYKKLLVFIMLLILIFIIFKLSEEYIFCNKCIQKEPKKLDAKCYKCPNDVIFKGLKIVAPFETLNEILKHDRSISRYGDGEYILMRGGSIPFQIKNNTLSKRLKEILISNKKNLLVGIYVPNKSQLNLYYKSGVTYWTNLLNAHKFELVKLINKKKKYYAADITRFYNKYKDKSKVPEYINNFKKLWNNRDIVFVEGEKSRLGYGNDFFDNARSIKRIICPNFNAFNVYDKILNSVLKINKDNLILIALGPTATVLAYDLAEFGYQAVDIGHSDIEYEYYIRNSTPSHKMKINHKFGLGINNIKNVENITDINYYNQIVDKIVF